MQSRPSRPHAPPALPPRGPGRPSLLYPRGRGLPGCGAAGFVVWGPGDTLSSPVPAARTCGRVRLLPALASQHPLTRLPPHPRPPPLPHPLHPPLASTPHTRPSSRARAAGQCPPLWAVPAPLVLLGRLPPSPPPPPPPRPHARRCCWTRPGCSRARTGRSRPRSCCWAASGPRAACCPAAGRPSARAGRAGRAGRARGLGGRGWGGRRAR